MADGETSGSATRFASVSDADYQTLLLEKDSLNTRKATDGAIRVFKDYLREKGHDVDYHSYSASQLDSILCKFFAEARNKKGDYYKRTTLAALRHGINRSLEQYDIINSPEFAGSSKAFKAVNVDLKKQGYGGIDHHPPLEKTDLEKLYNSFDIQDPGSLQSKVFVDILLHFGRRGRENIRQLKISDFSCTSDADGWKYIYMVTDEQTKNHQLDTNTAKGRMYEIKDDDERCPVKCFVKYRKMLPPGVPYLFPKVRKTKNKDGYYFDNVPLGHNKLGKMMTVLSEKCRLSRIYTNHSLRATSVHVLDCAHVPSRHIMSVTGHKSEQSLKTYTGFTDENTKKMMSHTLSKAVGLNVDETDAEPLTKRRKTSDDTSLQGLLGSDFDFQSSELLPLSQSDIDFLIGDFDFNEFEFDNVSGGEQCVDYKSQDRPQTSDSAKKIPLRDVTNTQNFNVSETVNYCVRKSSGNLPMPVIHAQNVTINYNF